jgi:hypothetical protein
LPPFPSTPPSPLYKRGRTSQDTALTLVSRPASYRLRDDDLFVAVKPHPGIPPHPIPTSTLIGQHTMAESAPRGSQAARFVLPLQIIANPAPDGAIAVARKCHTSWSEFHMESYPVHSEHIAVDAATWKRIHLGIAPKRACSFCWRGRLILGCVRSRATK